MLPIFVSLCHIRQLEIKPSGQRVGRRVQLAVTRARASLHYVLSQFADRSDCHRVRTPVQLVTD